MTSLTFNTLNFNKNLKVSYDGGNLSSDTGLLIPRSFDEALGLSKLIENCFFKCYGAVHTTSDVIKQVIYATIAGYHTDDAADDLRNDPVFLQVLGKNALASQPTVSRRLNDFDDKMLEKLDNLLLAFVKKAYQIKRPEHVILDIDSTHIDTYGNQQETAYNYHYSATGYHPLMLFDGITGDILKVELRKGSVYTSNNVVAFMRPVLEWFKDKFPDIHLILRGDSGFATPDLYELLDEFSVDYIIRLKANAILYKNSKDIEDELLDVYGDDYSKSHAVYSEFNYQSANWNHSRRVVCKVERKVNELHPRHTFIVTTLGAHPQEVIKAYQQRGNMENYIKEAKIDFGMGTLSHNVFTTNAAKLVIRSLAYNLMNFMKRLALPKQYAKNRMLTLRTILIKVAGRFVHSSRYVKVKFSSSFPYKRLIKSLLKKLNT